MNANRSSGVNRRNAVRIQDRVLFSWRPVTAEQYEATRKDFAGGISFYHREEAAEVRLFAGVQNALDSLRERDRELADFLGYLDTKINLMLQKAGEEKTLVGDLVLQKVTISASGISFVAGEELPVEQILDMHLVLLPEYNHIYCFGRVVGCVEIERTASGPLFKIAVAFTLLMDEDRERLIQHNFRQQRLALSNRRATELS